MGEAARRASRRPGSSARGEGPAGGARASDCATSPARWPAKAERRCRATRGRCDRDRHGRARASSKACAPSLDRWAGRSPRWQYGSGAARRRAGCGSPTPTGSGPHVSTVSSSPLCRTASSLAGTVVPTRSSPSRSASRSACRRAATPRPRSATSSTPPSPFRAGSSSSPTATATRTAPPSLARPSSTTCAGCWSRHRQAGSADPVEAELIRSRDLAQVVHRVAEAPSEEELAAQSPPMAATSTPGRC